MHAAVGIPRGEYVPTADERVVMYGVTWARYEVQLAMRGDASIPRIAYLDGALEIMRPSKDHERIESYLGMLVEAFVLETGGDLSPYGSWTLKEAPKRAGVEPDECYLIGSDQKRETPDLVIEVTWTSGGIDKLEAYRRLGVPEVWFWKAGQIVVHVLRADAYVIESASSVLRGLDPATLLPFLDHPTAMQAVRAFRDSLNVRATVSVAAPSSWTR